MVPYPRTDLNGRPLRIAERYRLWGELHPEDRKHYIQRMSDYKCSLILGRAFGEKYEVYLAQHPELVKTMNEIDTLIEEWNL